MATVKIFGLDNSEKGEMELSDKVFGAPVNRHLIWEAVNHYLACGRAGTASTKARGDVKGSGRKLWRQKGTGRARVGNVKTPKWRGGGVVHGPKPRDFSYAFPKQKRRGALRSALSMKLAEGQMKVVEDWTIESHKTREFLKVIGGLGVENRTLVIDSQENRNLEIASRNVPKVKCVGPTALNIHDLLKYDQMIISAQAIQKLEEVLSK